MALCVTIWAAIAPGRLLAGEPIRIAVFDVDATPPIGSAMAYQPVRRLDELTLRCRGLMILGSQEPIVLCAVDWIGIANEGHDAFREGLAKAAGTRPERVAVHTLHQHDAPGCDFTAEKILAEIGVEGYSRFDGKKPTQSVARIFLNANDYSPKLQVASVGNRVFELRTYIATPNNLAALNNRFRNHTIELFKKHGMNNVIYWSVASGESLKALELLEAVSPVGQSKADVSDQLPAAGNSLVYFLTHTSPDAQKASFGTFRDDPVWNQVRTDSEKGAGGSLTAGNGVKSWFLKPTGFSPLK
jgi:hypothetical protein